MSIKKVKAIDIANALGISKSTVSLALNGKSGVKEETRKLILDCKEKLENEQSGYITVFESGMSIKIICVERESNIEWGSRLDFPNKVMAAFDEEAKRDGFILEISYMMLNEEEAQRITEECMRENVAGVILMGTELGPQDKKYFAGITKPMVVYDTDFEDGRNHCVVPDNRSGIKLAYNYLEEQGIKESVYLKVKTELYVYNLSERLKAVQEVLFEKNINPYTEKRIVEVGSTAENIYYNIKKYFNENGLPEAVVCENCNVTFGVLRACRELHIKIPEDISVISIDEIPEFYSDGIKITAIKIPHEERAVMAMQILKMEIIRKSAIKSRVLTGCKLVKGNSVRYKI